jgi:uncharacterized membrane protein
VANNLPHSLRIVHAAGFEATGVLVTWPLIVALTTLGWIEALAAEVGLTLIYVPYG